MKYNIMVLSTQREYFYINITGNNNIDYCDLWIKASQKRYVKLHGFYTDIDQETLNVLKEKGSYKKYFDSVDDFIRY